MEDITVTQKRPRTAGGVSAGNEASCHRYKYTGRGRRHITGRYNSEKFGRADSVGLIPSPELLENIATSAAVSVKSRHVKVVKPGYSMGHR
jgi:predicted chitinase